MKNTEASLPLFLVSMNITTSNEGAQTGNLEVTQDSLLSLHPSSPCPSHADFTPYLRGTLLSSTFGTLDILLSLPDIVILMFKFFWKKKKSHKNWYIILNQDKLVFYTYLFYPLFSIHEPNFSFKFIHFLVDLFKNLPFHKHVIVSETLLLETHEAWLLRPTLHVETQVANPPIQCGIRLPFFILTSIGFFLS